MNSQMESQQRGVRQGPDRGQTGDRQGTDRGQRERESEVQPCYLLHVQKEGSKAFILFHFQSLACRLAVHDSFISLRQVVKSHLWLHTVAGQGGAGAV